MDSSDAIQLVILLILLALSAFFSSAETAYSFVNKIKMKTYADEGNKRAKKVLQILDNPGKMLSTILIGNNIVNISITSLATTLTIRLFGSVFVGIVTGLLTVLILIFGEIVPKTAASTNAEILALTYATPVRFLMFVLTPLIFLIEMLSNGLLKLLHIDKNASSNPMTESELKTYVDVSHEDGVIESEEREMILNVFDFDDSLARDVMIPRINITMVDVDASYGKLQNIYKNTMYSRIPVYEEDKDHIIGIVNLKDFFLVSRPDTFQIKNIMRDVYYTYETKKTSDLLLEMRESTYNVAVVLDEYGSAVGIITLEDLLEEIVGEIRDEYDQEEEQLLMETDTNTYDIAGSMKLDDINDALETNLDSDDYDSIGGLMIEKLDHFPKKNEMVTLEDGTILTATNVIKNRILRVQMILNDQSEECSANELHDTEESMVDENK